MPWESCGQPRGAQRGIELQDHTIERVCSKRGFAVACILVLIYLFSFYLALSLSLFHWQVHFPQIPANQVEARNEELLPDVPRGWMTSKGRLLAPWVGISREWESERQTPDPPV